MLCFQYVCPNFPKQFFIIFKTFFSVFSTRYFKFLILLPIFFTLYLIPPIIYAAQVTLAWDASVGSVEGYKIHYGATSGDYDYSANVGNSINCTISGLQEGATYYFAVTAYNNIAESDYSNEILYTIPFDNPNVDSDGDGIVDAEEINIYGTHPNKLDTDGDGINDGDELEYWGDNWYLDYDSDGAPNLSDVDSDGDGGTDGIELSSGHDPADPLDVSKLDRRITEGLLALYSFDEGSGNTINDVSRVGTPLDLTVSSGTVGWVSGGLAVTSPVLIESAGAANKLIDACKNSNAISVEAWVKPANTGQSGPARIVTLSKDTSNRNLTMGQSGDFYDFRLRTTATGRNGKPSLAAPQGFLSSEPTHVVYTFDFKGEAILYINGMEVSRKIVGGDLFNWDGS